MSAPLRSATRAVELGGGFIFVERGDGEGAILAPHLQNAGVTGVMSPKSVDARKESEVATWARSWGLMSAPASVTQVHGAVVVSVPPLEHDEDADGMWSDDPNVVLCVRAADCAPVWLVDTASQRFALLHAGWRGAAADIAANAVDELHEHGTDPVDLAVAIGPHLQPCCFEVGPEVAAQFSRWSDAVLPATRLTAARQRDDSVALDLTAALSAQLRAAGVRAQEVFAATACTRCNPEIFHSYRRNGSGGPLMGALAARRA